MVKFARSAKSMATHLFDNSRVSGQRQQQLQCARCCGSIGRNDIAVSSILRLGFITTAAAVTVTTGCYAFSLLPARAFYHSSPSSSLSSLPSSRGGGSADRLVDMLPSDLDALNDDRVIGALGVQLLLFAGWTKSGSGRWERHGRNRWTPALTLRDRLDRITPTYKPGGRVDYSFDARSGSGPAVFGDGSFLSAGATISDLANTLESIGLAVDDFDAAARKSVKAMLTWRIPTTTTPAGRKDNGESEFSSDLSPVSSSVLLFIFSFDATPSCVSVLDCPLPGPTNELLAATAARYVRDNPERNVRIVAQWEVAAALRRTPGFSSLSPVTPVGTPGRFQNTAEIFRLMLCEWTNMTKTDIVTGTDADRNRDVILLAHPDHLRRVLWTAQTILRHRNALRGEHDKCAPPRFVTPPRLMTALHPYSLDWPKLQGAAPLQGVESVAAAAPIMNMFDPAPVKVQTNGEEVDRSWYDDNLGYFSDANLQKWTHQREVWLLYDHWAVAKGIVTGTIDADLVEFL